jgi:hypothetical protein
VRLADEPAEPHSRAAECSAKCMTLSRFRPSRQRPSRLEQTTWLTRSSATARRSIAATGSHNVICGNSGLALARLCKHSTVQRAPHVVQKTVGEKHEGGGRRSTYDALSGMLEIQFKEPLQSLNRNDKRFLRIAFDATLLSAITWAWSSCKH